MYSTTTLMILVLVPIVKNYPSGAPAGSCSSMSPLHNSAPSTATNPYTIALNATQYACTDTISVFHMPIPVTLSGTPDFKGFLCQSRRDINSGPEATGTLTDPNDPKQSRNKCQGTWMPVSLTHKDNSTKSSFDFHWKPSGSTNINVYIVCTVVQSKEVYWENLRSADISYSGTATTC